MEEEWRKINLTPYEVSSLGNVRRVGRKNLAMRKQRNGYCRVTICSRFKKQDALVHRLVCTAFHGEAPSKEHHADHINGVRHDNRSKNLRWLTRTENLERRDTPKGDNHSNAKLSAAKVRFIRSLPKGRYLDREIAVLFDVSRETVRDVRLNKVWRHLNA